jgi:hypothetical protein
MNCRKFLFLAVLTGLGWAGLAPPAEATFEILVYVNGTLTTVTGPNGNTATNGSTNNSFFSIGQVGSSALSVNISSLTTFPGVPSGGLESNTTNGVVTVGGALAVATTITIVISENNWTEPAAAPLLLSSSAGGSISSGGTATTVTSTNQGFINNTNVLPGLTPGGTSTPLANASATLAGAGTASLVYTPSPGSAVAPGGVPFSMTEVFTYTFAAGSYTGGGGANVSGSVSVAPIPAPAGLVLALTGLPCLGIGAWLRRRFGKAV